MLSTFEKCKIIRNSLLTRVGEAMNYSWTNDFKIENLENINESLKHWEENNGSFKINPQDLSLEEMEELGFKQWEKENKIRLIPIWLFPFLCEEFESFSIFGTKYTKKEQLDTDHRFGCLAYGVLPKQ